MRLLVFILAASTLLASAGDVKYVQPHQVVDDITEKGLRKNIENFQKIADKNGKTRAFGTPGYKASVDFVLKRVRQFKDKVTIKTQEFSALYATTTSISLTEGDESIHVISFNYNHPTPADGVTLPIAPFPIDDARGSGCFEDQWAGVNATGTIPLIKRGICAVSEKLKLAKAHGASAALIYHSAPGTLYGTVNLGVANLGTLVPAGLMPLEVAQAWISRVGAGENVVVTLDVDAFWEQRKSWNVIAETKAGNPDNIIMLGAHLDSVQAGPGINDDASGSALLLEAIASIKKYRIKNKVRFAWWGAEESGLLGSYYYTSQLSAKEAAQIRVYNNYDMVSAINPVWGVFRGDEVSSQLHFDYMIAHGATPYFGGFGFGDSDYQGFLNLNVSSSGLYAGVDPCYHTACDTAENINYSALLINSRAAAFSMATMAVNSEASASAKQEVQERENLKPFEGHGHEDTV